MKKEQTLHYCSSDFEGKKVPMAQVAVVNCYLDEMQNWLNDLDSGHIDYAVDFADLQTTLNNEVKILRDLHAFFIEKRATCEQKIIEIVNIDDLRSVLTDIMVVGNGTDGCISKCMNHELILKECVLYDDLMCATNEMVIKYDILK